VRITDLKLNDNFSSLATEEKNELLRLVDYQILTSSYGL
jgi:hypothetical protein